MYKIDNDKLLEIIETLKEARRAISPEAINGNQTAGEACDYIFNVFSFMQRWEGREIDPEDITWTCSELEKALKILRDPEAENLYHAEDAEALIDEALSDLREEKIAAQV